MRYLILAILYPLLCAGGRVLLRRIRQNGDLLIYLRCSQKTTLAGLLIAGFITAALLGAVLFARLTNPSVSVPLPWQIAATAGAFITLFLLLVHYTESDWVQLGVFFLVTALSLLGLLGVYSG